MARKKTPEGKKKDAIIDHFGERDELRIFKNFSGRVFYEDAEGDVRTYSAGLTVGGSLDLIIIQKVRITPEMVGTDIGAWVVADVKKDYKETYKPKQRLFADIIVYMGGRAGIVVEPEDLEKLLWPK